jgi:ribosomal protein S18 acetylase RimI-like enzyme
MTNGFDGNSRGGGSVKRLACTISEAGPQDLVRISNLAHRAWWDHYPGIISSQQIAYMLSRMYGLDELLNQLQQGTTFLLARCSIGQLCGFSGFHQEGDQVWLDKLYVAPESKRRGVGKALIEATLERAQEAGAKWVLLRVNRNNHPAIQFYQAQRFAIHEEIKTDIGSAFVMDDFVMERSIQ